MITLNLVRRATDFDPAASSYRLTLEVNSAQNITSKVFVNQRLRNLSNNSFEDVFAAVATPAQLEDFDEDVPGPGTSYYRTNKIDILSRNADYLNDVYDDIVWQVQKLVDDMKALTKIENEVTVRITENGQPEIL
jgi:hypothetical protein